MANGEILCPNVQDKERCRQVYLVPFKVKCAFTFIFLNAEMAKITRATEREIYKKKKKHR